MKTKIVATIGSKSSYKDGIVNLKGEKIKPEEISYDYLVKEFGNNDVDLIRLNLSHIDVKNIEEVFGKIKKAILKWEKKKPGRRIAVLADLPGPKIRFHFQREMDFKVGGKFTVHFEKEDSTASAGTVYVDNKPLKTAMEAFDRDNRIENVIGTEQPEDKQNSFKRLMEKIKRSDKKLLVLVGDGEVVMEVKTKGLQAGDTSMACKVITVKKSGIKGKKGFTLKGVHVDIPTFTEEDRKKLDALLEAEYTGKDSGNPVIAFIALSFAQYPDDILRVKEHIECKLTDKIGKNKVRLQTPSIIAKIETELGWQNKDYILDVADGIMVARGDLGLQIDIEEVPTIQKKLIRLCNKRGKPVITATEMLKSMTESIEPTRAEGTDVFNAILDGSDAVMTSEETAVGKYPFHALRKMKQIAYHAENYFEKKDIDEHLRRAANLRRYQEFLEDDFERIKENSKRLKEIYDQLIHKIEYMNDADDRLKWMKQLYEEKLARSGKQPVTNRVTQATCTMSETPEIKGIIAGTTSGRTVRMISRLKPGVVIIGAAHDIINTRKLLLSYGVVPVFIGDVPHDTGTEELFEKCTGKVLEDPYLKQLLEEGDIVFTAGAPSGKPGTTNMIQMRKITPKAN